MGLTQQLTSWQHAIFLVEKNGIEFQLRSRLAY